LKEEEKIRKISAHFYKKCLVKNMKRPTLADYIRFVIQKEMSMNNETELPADYNYYLNKNYYYNVKINMLYRIVGGFIGALFKKIIMKM
jgi:hypothetical protein